jgi:hypothetical protein
MFPPVDLRYTSEIGYGPVTCALVNFTHGSITAYHCNFSFGGTGKCVITSTLSLCSIVGREQMFHDKLEEYVSIMAKEGSVLAIMAREGMGNL